MRRYGLLLVIALAGCGDEPAAQREPWLTNTTWDTHAIFPLASGAHFHADCNTCHGAYDTFRRFSCVSCHEHDAAVTDPNHTGVTGYTWSETSCIQCHPSGQALDVDHAKNFPILPGDTHGNQACGSCHIDPSNRAVLGCTVCHGDAAMAGKHGPVGGYAWTSTACIRCHGDSQVNRVSAHLPFRITSGAKHYRESCLGCHPVTRADKTFAADFSLAQVSCSACHRQSSMDDQHRGMPGYSYTPSSCLQSGCHQNGSKP